ncbi:MAG: hypothetical protein ACKO6H_01930 [Betaproteobacteria bacterium]
MFNTLDHTVKVFDETNVRIEGLKSGRIDANGWESPPEPKSSLLQSKELTPEAMAERGNLISKEEAKRREALTRLLRAFVLTGIAPPLMVLALGFIAAWVIAGFRSSTEHE